MKTNKYFFGGEGCGENERHYYYWPQARDLFPAVTSIAVSKFALGEVLSKSNLPG